MKSTIWSRAVSLRRHFTQALIPCYCFAVAVALIWTGAAGAEGNSEQLQAYLEAGEFGPAKELAVQLSDTGHRDNWLSQIAAAQGNAGARHAAGLTAIQIRDDYRRSTTLERINSTPLGAEFRGGGGPQADFESLIELITTTVAPTTWEDVGGVGAIQGFPGGVYVDPSGVLRQIDVKTGPHNMATTFATFLRRSSNRDVFRSSELRFVSLPRLEREVQRRWVNGRGPDATMQALAGLQRIRYVMVFPDSGDVVLAGPAGEWTVNQDGRWVDVDTGRPVVRLDDLVVLLRNVNGAQNGRFRCSIDPMSRNLTRTQAFLAASAKKPLGPSRTARQRWLDEFQENMGLQKITVQGIDPRTRVARTIVEADYRMKRLGMGLDNATADVTAYLDSIDVPPGDSSPLDIVRWWFTLDYEAIHTLENRTAFEIRGQGVKVLSEQELLTQQGNRIRTGQSNETAAEYAHQFTRHFQQLAVKYPIFAELQNIFDLALATALLRQENLPSQVGWSMMHFSDTDRFQVTLADAPKWVSTIVQHRVVEEGRLLAAASGGVSVNTQSMLQKNVFRNSDDVEFEYRYNSGSMKNNSTHAWWWDAAD